jgi:diguanylate cyclase (GGDEF)-like protein/putative nucleotidyltransferase with HDIG domain
MFASGEKARLAAELAAARTRIHELEAKLVRVASRDRICGDLLTLSAFRAQLEFEVQRAQRYGRPLSAALIDVDGFRQFNLRNGYGAGDELLRAVGAAIVGGTRTSDLASRIGADEFAVLFLETDPNGAAEALGRILVSLESLECAGLRGHSASAGIAVLEPGQTPEKLLAAAGTALEAARAAGGGRTVVFATAAEHSVDAAMADAHGDVIAALASALEERDRYTSDHSESVVDLAAKIGEILALDSAQVARVRTAALLHDIGKVGVPDDILHKQGPLDDREWEIMRQHPVIGERILRAFPGMGAVARAVRHEHERWDGNGYPDGLAGEEIPIEARIILACDAYHAMVSDRPYRKAMSDSDAMRELTDNAGSQFDPQVVEALVGYLYGRRQSGLTAV